MCWLCTQSRFVACLSEETPSALLVAQYGGKVIIPLEDMCQDYFSHLTPTVMLRKT
ncbi:MAG: pyocin activator PrtN family protein [Bradyrhizobiaceae bacterium]|nr:pyocin activator PrtN family protein [Bradyrhizobiaceae bacterium]